MRVRECGDATRLLEVIAAIDETVINGLVEIQTSRASPIAAAIHLPREGGGIGGRMGGVGGG